jgi:outer membrane protein TolC
MLRGVVSAARPVYYLNRLSRTGRAILLFASIRCLWGQPPPVSPRGPWHSAEEQRIVTDARRFRPPLVRIDPERVYSLAELIDLTEANNPETRVAWEDAVAQAGAPGVARSELFPTLAAVALAGADREEVGLGAQFYRQTVPTFQLSVSLNCTIFDFGARRGRINAEGARLLASNFGFNDVHLEAQFAEVRREQAERQQARATFNPSLSLTANPSAQSLYIQQQTLLSGRTAALTGGAAVSATRNQIEDEVWTAYGNLNAAFRQRQAATELVNSATQSYNAQKVLAQARSTDVLARTQVLAALADLTFRTGDAIQANARKTHP